MKQFSSPKLAAEGDQQYKLLVTYLIITTARRLLKCLCISAPKAGMDLTETEGAARCYEKKELSHRKFISEKNDFLQKNI